MTRDQDTHTRARQLAPWHLNVALPGGSTHDFHEQSDGAFYDPSPGFRHLLKRLYPDGLDGRSVLDMACNNGAFLFVAREQGAGRCVGYDVRDLWIEQARFLAELRGDEMEFDVSDLYDLAVGEFDLVIFSGVFYHLPDPIRGLAIAAGHCREILYVASMTLSGHEDGCLVIGEEGTEVPTSGVYGLQWFPTGPRAIETILAHEGLVTRRHAWFVPEGANPKFDAVQVIAARDDRLLRDYDAWQPRGEKGRQALADSALRPR